MKRIGKHAVALGAALALGAVVGTAGNASAWNVRHHASDCTVLGGAPIDLSMSIQNDSATSAMVLICPATDTDTMPKASDVNFNIHGFDNSTVAGIFAATCRSTWDVVGGACAPQFVSSGIVQVNASLSRSAWTSDRYNDFGYAIVSIPAKQGSFRSSFRGYFQSN
ncbi:MAG: hypothetical protein RL385_439 [Pseudomonadota bacterium]